MSNDENTKKVNMKWETDGNLAVLYKVENLLLFFSADNDPRFKFEQEITADEALKCKPYKAIAYKDEAIPSDAYRPLVWH